MEGSMIALIEKYKPQNDGKYKIEEDANKREFGLAIEEFITIMTSPITTIFAMKGLDLSEMIMHTFATFYELGYLSATKSEEVNELERWFKGDEPKQ